MSLVHTGRQLLWQLLHAIHDHLLSTGAIGDSNLTQRIPGLVSFSGESCDDPHSGIVLVKRSGEFLSRTR